MIRRILLAGLVVLPLLVASQRESYSRVKVYLDGNTAATLLRTGIEPNYLNPRQGYAICELSGTEMNLIKQAGFRYDVLITDMEKFYRERNERPENQVKNSAGTSGIASWPVPANFTLGSCGGFLTLNEMTSQLDLMRELYPNLVTVKQSICDTVTSIEGRPIYFVKISDNPDLDESEPQVLYTGMHHAREPIGMQHLIYYMWYLLENYSVDNDIKNLVDNTEMYFVPVVNVDGYAYNISTVPNGGGMWRKNRRNSGGGNWGIDLNRNYGYMWGYDDEGSSPYPSSETYRGNAPFSEPETRMIRHFCDNHEFRIALNYHSYSNLFLYAWGYIDDLTPDEAQFNAYASLMTQENKFTYGPACTTIYPSNGGSDDWMYGEQDTKPKILAYTPEVGGSEDGFWPAQNRIIPLCQVNMLASITAARLVGIFGKIYDSDPLFLYQDNGYIRFDVKRLGMQEGDLTVSVTPMGDAFSSVGPPVTFSGLSLLERRTDSVAYQLAPGNHVADTLRYVLTLDNGLYTVSDTIEKIYGYPYTVFSDDLSNKDHWTGTWGLSGNKWFSPPSSMTDSPFGNYGTNENRSTTLTNAISLNTSILTVLEFRARWALENDYDFVQLKISANNGTTWTPLAGKYTNAGTTNQLYGQALYDGTESEWMHEAISLNNWQDKNIKLRFTLDSDGGTELDGFYFDDLVISDLLDPTAIAEPEPAEMWLGIPSPNPAEAVVRISYLVPLHATQSVMKVYNTSGMMMTEMKIHNGQGFAEIPVDQWPAGLYYIQMESKGIPSKVRKLLVL